MSIVNILYAVLVLAGMGLLFGLLLGVASKFFAVPTNEKRDAVRAALPGANCGACGFPGCDACADAIVSGKASPNVCPVGGAPVAQKIGAIMGVETQSGEKKVARVLCQGDVNNCRSKFDYHGIQDCVAATTLNDGNKACKYACLGLGTCVRACPFDAIHIDKARGIAVVDEEKCQSCGKCVAACPKNVLSMQPVSQPVRVACRVPEEGYRVSDNCRVGCIGCGRCEEACKFDAIKMVNHLPQIDLEKCRACMMCYEACPTHAIWADLEHRRIAKIDKESCIGCGLCKRTCKFGAVVGDLRQVHTITHACTGCGECAEKCPKKCIVMKVRDHARDSSARVEPALAVKPTEAVKPKFTPEMQAKIDAALAAKAAKEAVAKAAVRSEAPVSDPKAHTEAPAEIKAAEQSKK